jgi:hypothetical protein
MSILDSLWVTKNKITGAFDAVKNEASQLAGNLLLPKKSVPVNSNSLNTSINQDTTDTPPPVVEKNTWYDNITGSKGTGKVPTSEELQKIRSGAIGASTIAGGLATNLLPKKDTSKDLFIQGDVPSRLPENNNANFDSEIMNRIGTMNFSGSKGIGLSHNNPGNLIYAGQPNAVKGTKKDDGTYYAKFPDIQTGYRALIKQVQSDQNKGLTLKDFITKYAPASDNNNTKEYLNFITKSLNAKTDDKINNIDTFELAKFLAKRDSGTTVE